MSRAAVWSVSDADARRFWERVIPGETVDDCWGWSGSTNKGTGYSTVRAGGNTRNAHRVSYIIANGPIGVTEVVDHLCRNKACTNPRHLEAVPQSVNVQRGKSDACDEGHALDGTRGRGANRTRYCRTCRNAYQRAARAARKAAA